MPRSSRAGPHPWDPPDRSGNGYASALSSPGGRAPSAAPSAASTGSPPRGPGMVAEFPEEDPGRKQFNSKELEAMEFTCEGGRGSLMLTALGVFSPFR